MKRQSNGPDVSFFAFQDIITAVVGIFILITIILILELLQRVEAVASAPAADSQALETTLSDLQAEIERLQAEYTKRIDQRQDQADTNVFNQVARTEAAQASIRAATERLATLEQQLATLRAQHDAAQAEENTLLSQLADQQPDREELDELKATEQAMQARAKKLAAHEGLLYRNRTDAGRFLCLITLKKSAIEIQDAATESSESWSGSSRIQNLSNWLDNHTGSNRHFLLLTMPDGANDFEAVRAELRAAGEVFGFDVIGENESIKLRFELESPE